MNKAKSLGAWALALAATVAHADTKVDRSVAATPSGKVQITNVAGKISVVGWPRDEVRVTGTLGAGVERLDVLQDGDTTIVKVILPNRGWRKDGDARLVVNVPAASRVEVSAVSADVASDHVTGEHKISTVSGDLKANVAGPAEIKSVSGDVSLQGSASALNSRISTVSGDIRLTGFGGTLEITTVSGNVAADIGLTHSLRVRTTSGDIRATAQLPRDALVDASTVSGDLNLKTPSQAGYKVEADSFSGDIRTCFGVRGASKSGYGPGQRLATTRRAGSGVVRAKSMSGDMLFCE